MTLQACAVIIDAVEHHRRNRKHHPRRREFTLGQHMMDQAAVHTSVAVLERVNIDKAEGGRRGCQHRVDAVVAHAIIRLQQAAHEIVEIAGLRADEFRERIAVMIPFA